MKQPYIKKGPFETICRTCGLEFMTPVRTSLYCSEICRPRRGRKIYSNLTSGSTGAVGELRVCSDLLIKGWEVFRAVSPSCSCDLIAIKNGRSIRIEVRTAHLSGEKIVFPNSAKDTGRQDCFAAVLENKIVYIPELPEKVLDKTPD